MRRILAGLVCLAGLAGATAAEARGWVWISQTTRRDAVAAIGDDHGSSLSVTCVSGPKPTYLLVIDGPMASLKPGRGLLTVIEGRRPVALRLDGVRLPYRGVVQLTGRGGDRATLRAIQSLYDAKGPIVVSSGTFRFSVSSLGVRWAMAPLIRRCGDPATLIRRARP
ncbi:MAG: hypothetical protein ACOYM5_01710 [Caulobacter sp.]